MFRNIQEFLQDLNEGDRIVITPSENGGGKFCIIGKFVNFADPIGGIITQCLYYMEDAGDSKLHVGYLYSCSWEKIVGILKPVE